MTQGAVNTGGRHFKASVFGAIDFQCKLQLARHAFAVFHVDGLNGGVSRPRHIDRDAQETSGGAFNLYQVVT
jgi:hypothetical protein